MLNKYTFFSLSGYLIKVVIIEEDSRETILPVRIYCLHLATGRTIHTRSGSGPTIYRGGTGSDRGDQTGGDRNREERRTVAKKPEGEKKRGRRMEDGWTKDCNLIPS
ncbi:hypothetical protein TNIN_208191 [Trichonephila inaurata madagascariensis]|uniref:Uncharacterized protein n=1 Tax=Trichonephila inaurata madagascariensis TaxID=2747483 RepID=A0A8X7C1S8_9ARAC|nr:hypothetical protein TNIN_208191 [Trichonephila inaurata madagascariensis]